jgi:hypothetical protein
VVRKLFSDCSMNANHSVLNIQPCNQYARSDSHRLHNISRARRSESISDDPIVHEFDAAGRLITAGEDRVFTLLEKVKAKLDGLHIQASPAERRPQACFLRLAG